jgi:hypothetical protein
MTPLARTTAKIVFDASLEVRGAVVYASPIEALALPPIFFLKAHGRVLSPLRHVVRPGGTRLLVVAGR